MRELDFNECEITSGGIITVSADGTQVSASEGTMTMGENGAYSIHTNDGWSYYRNSDSTWSLWNNTGDLVGSGSIYILNPP